ncbi:VOC family protein [Nocardioides convexus]|uniref:VOC family protein n=1 Tax=Nocardioides convexus TaxID=2712224 RepID=UPI0024181989|nr:VOC family protein [Nocardioides convexus]
MASGCPSSRWRPCRRPPGPARRCPSKLHLDFLVDTRADLEETHRRALESGAVVRLDRVDDPEEPLRVYADPAGHTFCVFTHDVG